MYISAATCPPLIPSRYFTTKRAAEDAIAQRFPGLRSVFVRAPFMYASSRPYTMPIAVAGGVAAGLDSAVGGRLGSLVSGARMVKPLNVETVAEAVVEAAGDQAVKGALEVEGKGGIEELGVRGWRRGML